VLVALWEAERLTARQIHERVGVPLRLGYTTTTKVLERLCPKGL
jgi:predicted transcriptional regulator